MKIGDMVTVTVFGLVYHGYIHNITDKYIEVHHSPFDIDVKDHSSVYNGIGIDKISTAHGYAEDHIHVHGTQEASPAYRSIIATHISEYKDIKRYFIITQTLLALDGRVRDVISCSYDVVAPYLYPQEVVIQDFRRAFDILLEDGYTMSELVSLFKLSKETEALLEHKGYDFWKEGDPVSMHLTYMTADGYISYKEDGVLKARYNPYEAVGDTLSKPSELVLYEDDIISMSMLQLNNYTSFIQDIEDGRRQYVQALHYISILNHLLETYALFNATEDVDTAIKEYNPNRTTYGNLASYFKETLIQYSNTIKKDVKLIVKQFGLTPDEIIDIFE